MAIVHDFKYVRPERLEEAVSALVAGGPRARVLAGGTDVVPWLRDDVITPDLLVDIKAIPDLDRITAVDGRLEIGALVTFSDLIASDVIHELAPMLVEMSHHVASIGVRNRATIVGNLCSAVPSLDAGPALLVYDAQIHMAGEHGTRTLPLDEWFVGPKSTKLAPAEIATGVTLALPPVAHAAAFAKLSRYSGEDLAQANLATLATADHDYRVAYGAVAPKPFRAAAIEALLAGRPLDGDIVAAARSLVPDAISPITDIRASAEYRTHMCGVMLERTLRAAASRLASDGPPYPSHLI